MSDESFDEQLEQMRNVGGAEYVFDFMNAWITAIATDEMPDDEADLLIASVAAHPNSANIFIRMVLERLAEAYDDKE